LKTVAASSLSKKKELISREWEERISLSSAFAFGNFGSSFDNGGDFDVKGKFFLPTPKIRVQNFSKRGKHSLRASFAKQSPFEKKDLQESFIKKRPRNLWPSWPCPVMIGMRDRRKMKEVTVQCFTDVSSSTSTLGLVWIAS